MSITAADRAGARQKARARATAFDRSRGVYPVTVGGIVAGYVERHPLATSKTAVVWSYSDPDGKQLGYGFNTRQVAVEMVADTEFAAKAYRESAREGTHGTAEERRVRDEDAAALAALDAQLDAEDGQPAGNTITQGQLAESARVVAKAEQVFPSRTEENHYELPGDPEVWGEAYRTRVDAIGDDGSNCCLCGKKTGNGKNTALVLVSLGSKALPYDDDAIDIDQTMMFFPVGSECAKTLPPQYVQPPQN